MHNIREYKMVHIIRITQVFMVFLLLYWPAVSCFTIVTIILTVT